MIDRRERPSSIVRPEPNFSRMESARAANRRRQRVAPLARQRIKMSAREGQCLKALCDFARDPAGHLRPRSKIAPHDSYKPSGSGRARRAGAACPSVLAAPLQCAACNG